MGSLGGNHSGGQGSLRLWHDHDAVVLEVNDAGRIHDPLVGGRRPALDSRGGRGVGLANQLSDLTQIRSTDVGTTVRVLTRR